jgi:galactonate dehydratase
MKISQLEVFPLPRRSQFLKLSTDEGLFGWGEPMVEGKPATVAAAAREMGEVLIGRDPDEIEDIWQTLYRGGFYRGGAAFMSAMAGIDQALWDLKGKRYGLPVWQLLGGKVRERMKIYAWIGGDTPEAMAQEATARMAQGYTAIKMGTPGNLGWIDSHAKVDAIVARVGAVREAIGKANDVALDLHGTAHKAMAKVICNEVAPFGLLFIEEPVLPENNEALRDIANHTHVPIATGERIFSRWEFKQILQAGYVDIIQPDLSHAGGISEVKKIAAMAEAYDVAVAPHCPLGIVAFASSLAVDFCTPNAFIQEQVHELHDNANAVAFLQNRVAFQFAGGHVGLPIGVGLGVQIDEVAVREQSALGDVWRVPQCRNDDGTVTEW